MNKKYTINNIEVTAEQIKDIIKNNPELLLEDKKVSGRYLFPKKGEEYFDMDYNNIHFHINREDEIDKSMIELGVYRTNEEAELARDKQKAIVACWKWAEENAPFEPDWEDDNQKKFYAVFGRGEDDFYCPYTETSQCQFTLPHFETEKDCKNFIEANKANLELLFTK